MISAINITNHLCVAQNNCAVQLFVRYIFCFVHIYFCFVLIYFTTTIIRCDIRTYFANIGAVPNICAVYFCVVNIFYMLRKNGPHQNIVLKWPEHRLNDFDVCRCKCSLLVPILSPGQHVSANTCVHMCVTCA